MPRQKSDPLIAALIAKLPPSGGEWPVDRQLSWLRLMAMAFGTVYGGDAVAQSGQGSTFKPLALVPRSKKPEHQFVIDELGYVRRGTGERVMPKDIDGEVFDKRGDAGDMRTIIWADDSNGLPAKQLVISA